MSTGERVSWVLCLLGIGGATAPFAAPQVTEPLGDGRFALVFVGGVMGLSAFVCTFVFRSRNRGRSRLLAGQDLLARWNYSEAEWRAFAGGEIRRQAKGKGTLLWITAIIMATATAGFTAYEPRVGLGVGLVLLVGWIVCWFAARASMRVYQKNESLPAVEARITADGLLLGAEFHLWRGWGARLERCAIYEGPPAQLEITYSMPGRYQRTEASVRVPIPAGKEAEAVALAQKLAPAQPLAPVA